MSCGGGWRVRERAGEEETSSGAVAGNEVGENPASALDWLFLGSAGRRSSSGAVGCDVATSSLTVVLDWLAVSFGHWPPAMSQP